MMEQQNRLRPLGVGDILDESFRLYRQRFVTIIAIAAAVLVPVTILEMFLQMGATSPGVLGLITPDAETINWTALLSAGVASLALGIITALGQLLMEGALAQGVSQAYLEGRAEVGRAYAAVWARFLPLLGASLLAMLVLGLLSVTFLGIPVALWLGVRWCLAVPVIVLERRGAFSGLQRSAELLRGSWWRTFGILILLGLLTWVLSLALGLGGGLVAGAIMIAGVPAVIGNSLANAIVTVLVSPFFWIGLTVLYYDRRVRTEGFDLERLAHQMLPDEDSQPPRGPDVEQTW